MIEQTVPHLVDIDRQTLDAFLDEDRLPYGTA